jgi:uncharacterized membrane protein YphA (DoxX/SURF4 family)
MRPRDLLLALARVALGALFLWAAATKVPNMAVFAEEVANYRLFPAAAIPLLASATVGIEILAGLALVTGVAARGAALVAGGLLLAFIAALSQALVRGIDLRCGCFGGAEAASWATVARDVAMLVPAVAVVALGPGRLLRRRGGADAATPS